MNVRHVVTVCLGAILLMFMCGAVYSQSLVPGGFFRDGFEDGSSRDSLPATWKRGVWDAEKDEVVDGDLHILGSLNSAVFAVDQDGSWLTYEDSVVLAQMRITKHDTGREVVGVFARSPGPTSYFGGIDNHGQLFIGGPNATNWVATMDTDIDPVASDVLMQLQLEGNEIDLTVWGEGEPKPSTPQLSFVDDQLASGAFGAFAVSLGGTPTDMAIRWIEVAEESTEPRTGLQAGDADQNSVFDQRDLVQVLVAGKYLTAEGATWGEGDWNGAPGGESGNPPVGDGFFDQNDIVAALGSGLYLAGPQGALTSGARRSDGPSSDGHDAGALKPIFGAAPDIMLASINRGSAVGLWFNGYMVEDPVLAAARLADPVAAGSLAGGGDLGEVDLIYVPEPSSALLLTLGLVIGLFHLRRSDG